ncbi:MAG: hypothetical protein AAF460_03255 [Pseudomonadota bacterium]
MSNRVHLSVFLVATAALSVVHQPVLADTLQSAHNALCMRLQQCAVQSRSGGETNGDVLQLFTEATQGLCSAPNADFGGKTPSAEGRELARACYRSAALQGCDALIGMDMDTPACAAFHQHLQSLN